MLSFVDTVHVVGLALDPDLITVCVGNGPLVSLQLRDMVFEVVE